MAQTVIPELSWKISPPPGFITIKKASDQNIEMQVYLKMILSKLRYSLMFRYAPIMKKGLSEVLSEDDITFIEELIKSKPEYISSKSLAILLEAYQQQKFSVISSLPLEMALIKILDGEK